MYIKQIVLEGFKSYKDHHIFEPFDTKHNVIIGPNGAGKSNIFHAIEFVLCASSSEVLRSASYSIGSTKVQRVLVEIILNNSDNKFPTGTLEVSLKRIIYKSKDKYFVNGMTYIRSAFVNLLEAAGLSPKCPNFIIREGQINQISTANNSYRFKLFYEGIGLKKYDEQLNKLTKSVMKTNLSAVDKQINKSTELCRKFSLQKESLENFTTLEQNKRAIIFCKSQYTLNSLNNKLQDVKNEQELKQIKQQELLEKKRQSKNVVKTNEEFGNRLSKELKEIEVKRDNFQSSLKQIHKQNNKCEYDIQDNLQQLQSCQESLDRIKADFESLQQTILQNETKLAEITPEYHRLQELEKEITAKLKSMIHQRNFLYAKQQRNAQFASKRERDKVLKLQLEELMINIIDLQESITMASTYLEKYVLNEETIQDRINQIIQQIEENKMNFDEEVMVNLDNQIFDLIDKIRELNENENKLELKLMHLEADYNNIDINRSGKIEGAILRGCRVIETEMATMSQENQNLYKGLVLNNFTCNESYFKIMENVAGKQLFSHIFGSNYPERQLLKKIKRNKKIDVTLIPILDLVSHGVEEVPNDLREYLLLEKIEYADWAKPIMSMIFGNTILCDESDEMFLEYPNLDYITWNGKYYTSKGEVKLFLNDSEPLMSFGKQRESISNEMKTLQQEIVQLNNEKTKLQLQLDELKKKQLNLSQSKRRNEENSVLLKTLQQQLASFTKLRKSTENIISNFQIELQATTSKRDAIENELQQDLLSQLSTEEQEELNLINQQIPELQRKQTQVISSRALIEMEEKHITSILTNLRSSLQNNQKDMEGFISKIKECELKLHRMQVLKAGFEDDIKQIEPKLEQIILEIEKRNSDLTNYKVESDKWMERKLQDEKAFENNWKRLNLLFEEASDLCEQISSTEETIVEFATQSRAALERYENMSEDRLNIELKEIKKALKESPEVNMQAVQQYSKTSTQLETFTKERDELHDAHEAIMAMFSNIETKKTQFFQQAFAKFSNCFSDIFKKLVPAGRGKLVIIKEDELSGEVAPNDTIDQYKGIGIKVAFKESSRGLQDLIGLSGGEKSLVAIAYTLALHMYDPAPFYLLDEIDHALDLRYRRTLAQVLHELSENTQFITTTHWAEQLGLANKIYKVSILQNASSVQVVSNSVAIEFIKK